MQKTSAEISEKFIQPNVPHDVTTALNDKDLPQTFVSVDFKFGSRGFGYNSDSRCRCPMRREVLLLCRVKQKIYDLGVSSFSRSNSYSSL